MLHLDFYGSVGADRVPPLSLNAILHGYYELGGRANNIAIKRS